MLKPEVRVVLKPLSLLNFYRNISKQWTSPLQVVLPLCDKADEKSFAPTGAILVGPDFLSQELHEGYLVWFENELALAVGESRQDLAEVEQKDESTTGMVRELRFQSFA